MRIRSATGALASGLVLVLGASLGLSSTAGAVEADKPAVAAAKRALADAQDALHGTVGKPTRDATMALRDLWAAKDALSGADAAAAKKILSRPTDPGDDDYYGDGADVQTACGDNVCLHWVETGEQAATPAYAAETLATVDAVHETYVDGGYKPTLPDEGQGGSTKPDIYLAQIGVDGVYGYCTTDAEDFTDGYSVYAYCVLDNDYSVDEFGDTNTPTENMQVTAAHEYFHAVQYGYDAMDDGWVYETTATWAEDEVFDDVNDNWNYLPYGQLGNPDEAEYDLAGPGTPLDIYDLASYGNWIWIRYLTEKIPASTGIMPDLVREVWEGLDSTGGAPENYSMRSLQSVLAGHGTSVSEQFAQFSLENNTPGLTYEEGADADTPYPYPAYAFSPVQLTKNKKSVTKSLKLDHLTSGTGAFLPFAKGYSLKVIVDMTNKATGSRAGITVYKNTGEINRYWIKLSKKGNGSRTVPFASDKVAAVEVTLVNASDKMKRCGEIGDVFSCQGTGKFDNQKQELTVKAAK